MPQAKKPENNQPVRVFGRWREVREIKSGGFGTTVEVEHLDYKKFAVVKIIKSEHYGDEYDDFVRRFKREIKILSNLNHPNICRFYEADLDAPIPWFAMERYKGNTVIEELEQYGPAPEKIWFDRARDILEALEYAHREKVMHGDLNPNNVIIDGRGAKLIDFGIARKDNSLSGQSTRVFGANGWTSPQYGTLPPTIQDDIFVAASLLVLLGTGHRAFKANTVDNYLPSIINDDPDYSGLSTNQIQLLRRMHQKSREQRCTASGALADIDKLEPSASARPLVARPVKIQAPKKPDNFQRNIDIVNNAGELAKVAFANPLGLAKNPMVQDGVKVAFKYKGLTIASLLLGGVPLISYWIISRVKRTKDLGYLHKFPLSLSALAYFMTFGILSPIATIWWGRRLGFKSFKISLILQSFFGSLVLIGTVAEANQEPSGFLVTLRIIGFVLGVLGYRKVVNKLLGTETVPVMKKPEPIKDPSPPTTKVEIREGLNGSQIVGTHHSWAEVETFFTKALSSKRGKRFIFEIESDVYSDIYFQGYSEPDSSRTIEAAADLAVHPPLTDSQKLSMTVIGWDLPSEDLPNFIMFLEASESKDASIAAIFARTLREGYGLELGTFRVIAPVR